MTTRTFWAPGRLNLIGEYTDLSGGLVLPVAIDLGVRVDASAADRISLSSRELPCRAMLEPDGGGVDQASGWARYVAAVAAELALLGRPPVGLEGEIESTLPIGAGLSSSAALEVATALALCRVADFALEPLELVQACRRAEHRAVGVPCGILDQAASVLGRAGHALLLDTSTLEYEHVPLPDEVALVSVDSGISRRLEDSGYGERGRELERAFASLEGRELRDLTVADVNELGETGRLEPVPARRLRHVVSENERVRETARLLREPSVENLRRLGEVFREGHESMRRDFEATTPELDLLVDLAYDNGAIAARMTGGGFGGSIVALSRAREVETFAATVKRLYRARVASGGDARVCRASDGARELT